MADKGKPLAVPVDKAKRDRAVKALVADQLRRRQAAQARARARRQK